MEYAIVHAKASEYYHTIGDVFSPALQEKIYFSNHGFRHILFRKGCKGRERNQQIKRFSILPLAVELVGLSTTYQEFETRSETHHKKMKSIHYWGVIAILHHEKIKVVIRRMGRTGKFHFWSIIPNARTSLRRDEKLFKSTPPN